ncbi:MAG TPA: LysR family transcriptional regulator [Solirubrobacteraceae bacterium]|nr:LysR family transcriptional regulator [Solirubrobacteraceae bacterium]
MELRQLRYFAAVARHRHFGRAAEELYVTQSALSQQVARLEEELGLALALRTSRGVELTPAGAELLEHADEILGRIERARAAIDAHAGAVRGAARLASTAHDAGGLAGGVAAFHAAHPGVRLSVRLVPAAEAVALTVTGSVDVAVVGVHGDVPQVAPGLCAETLREEELVIAGAPGSALAGENVVTIETLRGAPLLLPARGTAVRAAVDAWCQRAGFSPLPVVETDDPRLIRALVARGLGLTVLPPSWLDGPGNELASARLTSDAGGGGPVHRLVLLRACDRRLTPVGRLLVEHLSAALGGGQAGGGHSGGGGQADGRSTIGGRSA